MRVMAAALVLFPFIDYALWVIEGTSSERCISVIGMGRTAHRKSQLNVGRLCLGFCNDWLNSRSVVSPFCFYSTSCGRRSRIQDFRDYLVCLIGIMNSEELAPKFNVLFLPFLGIEVRHIVFSLIPNAVLKYISVFRTI